MGGVFVAAVCRDDPAFEVFRGFGLPLRAQHFPGQSPNDCVE